VKTNSEATNFIRRWKQKIFYCFYIPDCKHSITNRLYLTVGSLHCYLVYAGFGKKLTWVSTFDIIIYIYQTNFIYTSWTAGNFSLVYCVLSCTLRITSFPHFNVPKLIDAPFFTYVVLLKQLNKYLFLYLMNLTKIGTKWTADDCISNRCLYDVNSLWRHNYELKN